MFNKSYDKIIKGFTKVTHELRELEQHEAEKALDAQLDIIALETVQQEATFESRRAAKAATKIEDLFGGEVADA
jgi:hypothetical protein